MPAEFRILGTTQVWVDGCQIDAGSAKQRALLALLLHQAGSVVAADRIVEQLWPGQDRYQVRSSLYALISRIRKTLTQAGLPDSLPAVADGYQLQIDAELVDLHRFCAHVETATTAARHGDHAVAISTINTALSWWHGPPLADLRSSWADNRRQHLEAVTRLDAYLTLYESHLYVGNYQTVLDGVPTLREQHQTDERLAGLWMRALDASGRGVEACRFYAEFQRYLVHEVGTPPSPELDAVYRQIADRRELSEAFVVPQQLPDPLRGFTGHQSALAQLDALAQRALETGGGVIVVHGMPGIGKTALAVQWAHQQADRFTGGHLFLNAGAHGPQRPLESAVGLAAMLQALGTPADRIPVQIDQRRRRLASLLTHRQVLTVLDDVADSAQARALAVPAPGCLTVITSRNRLNNLVIRDGAAALWLRPMDRTDSMALLRRTLPANHEHSDEALASGAALAGGIPLALRLVSHHLTDRPAGPASDLVVGLRQRLLAADDPTPGVDAVSLSALFTASERVLPPETRQLFQVLGLHPGWGIEPGAAAALAGTDPDRAAMLLNQLAHCHLVDDDTGLFTLHDLIRAYTANRAQRTYTPADLRAAHERLLDWFVVSVAAAAHVLAPHEPPVPDLPGSAVPARQFATDSDALRWCQTHRATLIALPSYALGHGLPRHAWQIAGGCSGLLDRDGPYTDLLAAHKIAATAAEADGHVEGRIGSINNLGAAYTMLHHYDLAAICFQAGLRLARTAGHADAIATCQHNVGSICLRLNDITTAIRHYKAVLSSSRMHHDRVIESSCLHKLGVCHRLLQHQQQASLYLHAALRLRADLGALREQAETYAELAAFHLDLGQAQPALQRATTALELDARTGDHAAETDTLITIAAVHHALGLYAEAIHDAQRAVDSSMRRNDSHHRARALAVLTDALRAAGHHDVAARAHRQAQALQRDLDASRLPVTDLPSSLQPHTQPHAV